MELLCTIPNANRNLHRNVACNEGITMCRNVPNNDVSEGGNKRQRVSWSRQETDAIIAGYDRYKGHTLCWREIISDQEFQNVLSNRTNTQLKDKIANLKKQGIIR